MWSSFFCERKEMFSSIIFHRGKTEVWQVERRVGTNRPTTSFPCFALASVNLNINLLQDVLLLHVCVSLSPSTAGLESDYCVWNVQRGPHVERFRQRRALPPPTNQPPQQDQLRGQPEQCPGNGFIRQLRFTASPAKHLLTWFPRIWWKTSKKQR